MGSRIMLLVYGIKFVHIDKSQITLSYLMYVWVHSLINISWLLLSASLKVILFSSFYCITTKDSISTIAVHGYQEIDLLPPFQRHHNLCLPVRFSVSIKVSALSHPGYKIRNEVTVEITHHFKICLLWIWHFSIIHSFTFRIRRGQNGELL
jgi:hypothetical protein